MSVATAGQPGGALERTAGGGGGGALADVVETVLDKGVVIDAQVSIAVVGIQLLEINARVVISSIETYLRYAEAVDRMSIVPKDQKTLPDLIDGAAGAAAKGTAVAGLGKAAQEISGAVADSVRDRGARRERSRRRDGED
ncbi:gas vesicle protein [Micromonospora sp. WMMC241]|uniref:gas vesicle protein GvpJ n=1 Tax=Micromonospora sp. WMMC241 TaxID=3015159 RepID=UPI0022B5E89F|nr:gas vesicle protein GvpJ [Micromonospora sp. WMMC241]MCZ7435072.1 gas vesicle protein [Micromonospora sp. WMMC241]